MPPLVVRRSWPSTVPKAYVLQVASEGANARALTSLPISGPLADQNGIKALKKAVLFQRLSVPAIKMSSLDGHFSNRLTNGAPVLSMPSSAVRKVKPPSVVRPMVRFCSEMAQCVSGWLEEMALSVPSPKKTQRQTLGQILGRPVHSSVPLS